MNAKEIIKKHFWETIYDKEQLKIAIEGIERWLEKPSIAVCPFGKEWEGGCSLCVNFFDVFKSCPCFVHGKEHTIEKAKEILQLLKSLQKKTGKE